MSMYDCRGTVLERMIQFGICLLLLLLVSLSVIPVCHQCAVVDASTSVNYAVSASTDDMSSYYTNGVWHLDSLAGVTIWCGSYVAASDRYGLNMRFQDVAVPENKVVTNAYLRVRCSSGTNGSNVYSVSGQLGDAPLTFSTLEDYQNRRGIQAGWTDNDERTVSSVSGDWGNMSTGAWYVTDNLASVVHEIVSSPLWDDGDDMVLFLDDCADLSVTGHLSYLSSWDTTASPAHSYAPQLYITYDDIPDVAVDRISMDYFGRGEDYTEVVLWGSGFCPYSEVWLGSSIVVSNVSVVSTSELRCSVSVGDLAVVGVRDLIVSQGEYSDTLEIKVLDQSGWSVSVVPYSGWHTVVPFMMGLDRYVACSAWTYAGDVSIYLYPCGEDWVVNGSEISHSAANFQDFAGGDVFSEVSGFEDRVVFTGHSAIGGAVTYYDFGDDAWSIATTPDIPWVYSVQYSSVDEKFYFSPSFTWNIFDGHNYLARCDVSDLMTSANWEWVEMPAWDKGGVNDYELTTLQVVDDQCWVYRSNGLAFKYELYLWDLDESWELILEGDDADTAPLQNMQCFMVRNDFGLLVPLATDNVGFPAWDVQFSVDGESFDSVCVIPVYPGLADHENWCTAYMVSSQLAVIFTGQNAIGGYWYVVNVVTHEVMGSFAGGWWGVQSYPVVDNGQVIFDAQDIQGTLPCVSVFELPIAGLCNTGVASGVGVVGAQLNGEVLDIGTGGLWGFFFWGLEDSTDNVSAWDQSALASSPSQPQDVGLSSVSVLGLLGDTQYFFRFGVQNVGGWTWGVTENFTTLECPSGSVDDISDISKTHACVEGEVLDLGGNESATFLVYWGLADGADNISLWEHSNMVGWPSQPQGIGSNYVDLTGLVENSTYYVRGEVSAGGCSAWAGESISFETLEDTGGDGSDDVTWDSLVSFIWGDDFWEGGIMYLLLLSIGSVIFLVLSTGRRGALWALVSALCAVGFILAAAGEDMPWLQIVEAVILGLAILSLLRGAVRGRA